MGNLLLLLLPHLEVFNACVSREQDIPWSPSSRPKSSVVVLIKVPKGYVSIQ